MQSSITATIVQEQACPQLPRINRQFIGLSHELQMQRKKRRSIEIQERSIANRVLFLQKEQTQTKKSLTNKKQQLKKLMNVLQRQRYDSEEKRKKYQQKQQYLEQLRKQNKSRRNEHEHNIHSTISRLHEHNHQEYILGKQKLKRNDKKKKQNKEQQQQHKRERVLDICIQKQKSRSIIDKFHKKKNKQYMQHYKYLIAKQDQKTKLKMDTISKLQPIETALRQQLKHSTLQVDNLQTMIMKVSKTIDGGNLSKVSASTNRRSLQQIINDDDNDEVQEKIQQKQQMQPTQEGTYRDEVNVHLKKRNKHKNRYHKYEAF